MPSLVLKSAVFLVGSAALCCAVTVDAGFEGGSVGKVEVLSERHLRLAVKGEKDQAGRNRQASWYYFRVDGAPKSELTMDLVDLAGEYNFQPNQGAISDKTPPLISYDQKTWTHVQDCEYDAKEPKLRVKFVPRASRFWLAHTPPYTNENLFALRKFMLRHPDAKEQVFGKTAEGRGLYLWSIGGTAGAKTAWLMFRQHSWESGSSWAAEGLLRHLLSPEAAAMRRQINWKIYPLCDPDGVTRGGVRFNRNGYDLNRNWDVEDAKLMPEITAQRRAIADWVRSGHIIDLFLTLHNTETSEYLEGPPNGADSEPVRSLAERFFAELRRQTTFDPSRPLTYSTSTTTLGMTGRMTAVQGLYRDFRVPGFLMEQRIAYNPKLGRLPGVKDRLEFGKQLANAIAATLRQR